MNKFSNYCPGQYYDLPKSDCNCGKPDFPPYYKPCPPPKPQPCPPPPYPPCPQPAPWFPICPIPPQSDCCNNNIMLLIGGILIGQMFNRKD